MCGRYRLTRSDKQLNEAFDAESEFDIVHRYNIAPSQPVVAIRQGARLGVDFLNRESDLWTLIGAVEVLAVVL